MGRVTYEEFYKERLDRLLLSLLGDEKTVEKWWNSPNGAFDYQMPIKVFDNDPNKVINYILTQFHY